jgi:hypothetical protein
MRRGTLRGFSASTYLAAVQIAGSLPTSLVDLPVARNLAAGEMVSGRNVAVLFFDEANPNDAVVAAVWTAP